MRSQPEKSVLFGQLVMASSWLIVGDAQYGLSCARSLEKILRLPRIFCWRIITHGALILPLCC